MLTRKKPTRHKVDQLLREYEASRITYDQIGATQQNRMPSGFNHDSCRVQLGQGRAAFQDAIGAFHEWRMFPPSMTKVLTSAAKIAVGQTVAIQFKALFLWAVCPCRIVYVVDEHDESARRQRFGFGYGTLPGHVENGEERFLLEWNRDSDDVWYSINAFSEPRHVLAKLAYPYARLQQSRFRRLSCESMLAAMEESPTSVSLLQPAKS